MKKDYFVKLRSGKKMPVMGLGTWRLTKDTQGTVEYALETGYRLIDTSSDYHTQRGIGKALKNSNIDRKEVFITTKVEEYDDAYERAKNNLDELEIDYVDLLLIHRPPIRSIGEELWTSLIRAKEKGLTKDIGVSNYGEELIDELTDLSGVLPVVNQIEWSPFGHDEDMQKYCDDNRIIIQAYSPLTRTRKLDDPTLVYIAAKYNKYPAQILIKWNIQRGSVPIPKANQQNHLRQNIDIFDFEIDDKDMDVLDKINQNFSSLGFLPYL